MINFQTILSLINAIGPALAATNEVKQLVQQAIDTFTKPQEQQALKDAYAKALIAADRAHDDLQASVAAHTTSG